MTQTPQELLAAYRREYETYKALAARVERDLKAALADAPFDWTISARPKSPSHLVLKGLDKQANKPEEYGDDPLAAMKDKAGARVIVPDLEAVAFVRGVTDATFVLLDEEDMSKRYRPDQLGYLGLHLQISCRPDSLGFDEQQFSGLECELQVHTKAQSAWATVSHPLLYKPVGAKPSEEVEARIMRAVALVSLFDDEVVAARSQVLADPRYRPALMLDVLQKAAIEWRRVEPDVELSLDVLAIVAGAYEADELDRFAQLIEDFVTAKRASIDNTYAHYGADDDLDLLFQPEAIAIYERLVAKPNALRNVWLESPLPLDVLEGLATAFAEPY